jgi:hypothetical protein
LLGAPAPTFRAHETDGKVTFEYDTKVYYGRFQTKS